MIKVKGIEEKELSWDYDSPPKFYKRIGKTPTADGVFKAEVYKLKSFNNFTKEAVYVKVKNEKLKSKLPVEQSFNTAIPKGRIQMED